MRREPKQRRSRELVDAVLEAVGVVAQRDGVHAVNTNRIAEVAGVSVGSLYQYFPDKRAIFAALHDRHVDDTHRVIETVMADCVEAPLEVFVRELVEGLMSLHGDDGGLHDAVQSSVPDTALGFERGLHRVFESVLSRSDRDPYSPDAVRRMLFVLPRMVESLVHGTARAQLSRDDARSEAVRAVLLYVNARSDDFASLH